MSDEPYSVAAMTRVAEVIGTLFKELIHQGLSREEALYVTMEFVRHVIWPKE